MMAIKVLRNILSVFWILLLAVDFLLVLPEYCACRNTSENGKGKTIWGYTIDCIGDDEDFSLIFFQWIGYWLIGIMTIIIILHIIYKRKKDVWSWNNNNHENF